MYCYVIHNKNTYSLHLNFHEMLSLLGLDFSIVSDIYHSSDLSSSSFLVLNKFFHLFKGHIFEIANKVCRTNTSTL